MKRYPRRRRDVSSHASEARFRALVANLEDVVFSLDTGGRIEYVSPASERVYGRPPADLEGRLFTELVEAEDLAAVQASFERTLAGAVEPIEFRALDSAGKLHHLRTTTRARVVRGRVVGVDGVISDVTALRAAEHARRASEGLLRTAFAAMPAAVAVVDLDDDLRFLEVNDAFAKLTGHTRDEAVGVNSAALGLYVDQEQRAEVLRRMGTDGQIRDFLHEIRRKDGGTAAAMLSIGTFQTDGRRFGVTVSLDVTERHKSRRELEQRLQFETLLGDLAGAFIHVSDERLEPVIAWAQRRICAAYGLDRSSVMLPRSGDGKIEATLLFPDEVAIARRGTVIEDYFPWSIAQLRRSSSPLVVADFAALPPEAARDRASYAQLGITSVLSVPWREDDGTLQGIMNFTSIRGRVLDESEVRQVATIAQLILVALGRARERRAVARGQERNRVLTEILDVAPAGIMVMDSRGSILYANRQVTAMHGYAAEESEGLELVDLLPEAERAPAMARLHELFDCGEQSFPVWHERKDGTQFHVQVRARRTHWGEQAAALSVQTDLTERDAAEANIRKLSQAVEQSPESIAILDLGHRIEYANEAFLRSTGHARADVIGRELSTLSSNRTAGDTYAAIWTAVGAGETWNGELEHVHADGTSYVERAIVAPLRQADGAISHFLAIKTDITETKRMAHELDQHRRHLEVLVEQRTDELRRARDAADAANHAKSRFLANMSHEIRTPMNAVLGFASLLLRDGDATATQRRHLETINRAGDHLMSLIDAILQLAKVESGHDAIVEHDFDLWGLADDIEQLFQLRATDKGLRLTFERDPSVPQFVHTDEGKLRQVISNLLGNAIKFTAAGGVTVRLRAIESRLRVEVEDTGAGIGEDELPRLFQKFEQTASGRASHQGTGLGLAISRELVGLLGGTIGVARRLAIGSVFHFELPLTEAAVGMVARGERPAMLRLAPGQPPQRVLVADDIEDNRTLLIQLLELVGFETRSCSDGARAVREVAAWSPHLVLTDVRMPVLDGIEAIRQIRAGGSTVAIVCVSASTFPAEERAAMEAGADRFMRKPVRESELLAAIGELLGVRYIQPAAAAPPAEPVTPDAIARLPVALRRELREATRRADLDAMLGVLDAARAHDARLAQALRELAERFAYKRLLELLEAS